MGSTGGCAGFEARGFARMIPAIALTVIAGCSAVRAPMRDAVRQCEESLPGGGYKVLETARMRDAGIFRVLSSRAVGARFPAYFVAGHAAGGRPRELQFVLLQRQPDELVYCEVATWACTPSLIWLERARGTTFDDWEVERTNADQQVIGAI